MNKKLFFSLVAVLAVFTLTFSNSSLATEEQTIDFSGGLLDNKTLRLGTYLPDLRLDAKKVTDNDLTTYDPLGKYDSGGSRMDHLVYKFEKPVRIKAFRLKTESPESKLRLYLIKGSHYETVEVSTKDGSLQQLDEKYKDYDVNTIALHNVGNIDEKIYEFNVYTEIPETTEPETTEPETTEPETTEPETTDGQVVLRIQMLDGLEKEYKVSASEADKFKNWIESRLNGNGEAIYTFSNKEFNRTEHIIYDKVLYFEIKK
ncbi:hypothetical protein BAMA_15485 [Bacillus manliponensis]|uniref:Uncharacterized protein n=1 Tax=Bacillus manliponensis TaxID=574376 RepID=A0A073JSY1_9BACI|nr:hypothetical protein [Bacillus manliponensis]KEK17357.1 hypothetical protein BAMA_15485 [Bacillus manliponensis]